MAVNRFDQPRTQQEVALQTINTFVGLPVNDLANALKVKQHTYDTTQANIDDTQQNFIATVKAREQDQWKKQEILKDKFVSPVDALIDEVGGDLSNPEFARKYSKIKSSFINDKDVSAITKLYDKHQEVMKKRLAMDDAESIDVDNPWARESGFNKETGEARNWEEWDIYKEKQLNQHLKKQEYFNQMHPSGSEYASIKAAFEGGALNPDDFALKESGGKLSTEGGLNKIIGTGKIDVFNKTVSDYANSAEGKQAVKILRNEILKANGYTYFDYDNGQVPKELTDAIDKRAAMSLYEDLFQVSKEFRWTQSKYDLNPINKPRPKEGYGSGSGSDIEKGLVGTDTKTFEVTEESELPEISLPNEGGGNISPVTNVGFIGVGFSNDNTFSKGTTPSSTPSLGLVGQTLPLNEDGTPNANSKNKTLDKITATYMKANGIMINTSSPVKGGVLVGQNGKQLSQEEVNKTSIEIKKLYDAYRQHVSKRTAVTRNIPKNTTEDVVTSLRSSFNQLTHEINYKGKIRTITPNQAILIGIGGTGFSVEDVLTKYNDEEAAMKAINELIAPKDPEKTTQYSGKTRQDLIEKIITAKNATQMVSGTDKRLAGAVVVNSSNSDLFMRIRDGGGTLNGISVESNTMNSHLQGRLPMTRADSDFIINGASTGYTSYLPTTGGGVPKKKSYSQDEAIALWNNMYDYDYINRGITSKDNKGEAIKYETRKVTYTDKNGKVRTREELRKVLLAPVDSNGNPINAANVADRNSIRYGLAPVNEDGTPIEQKTGEEGWEDAKSYKDGLSDKIYGANPLGDSNTSINGNSSASIETADNVFIRKKQRLPRK